VVGGRVPGNGRSNKGSNWHQLAERLPHGCVVLPVVGWVQCAEQRKRAGASLPVLVQVAWGLPMVPVWTPPRRPHAVTAGRRGRRCRPACGRCWPCRSPSCPPRRVGRSSPSGTATFTERRAGSSGSRLPVKLRGLTAAHARRPGLLDADLAGDRWQSSRGRVWPCQRRSPRCSGGWSGRASAWSPLQPGS
jgi:hypothetical protein